MKTISGSTSSKSRQESSDDDDGGGGGGPAFMPESDDDDPDSSGVFAPNTFGIETKNKEDWCDMSDPFENPFCPTPNPVRRF